MRKSLRAEPVPENMCRPLDVRIGDRCVAETHCSSAKRDHLSNCRCSVCECAAVRGFRRTTSPCGIQRRILDA